MSAVNAGRYPHAGPLSSDDRGSTQQAVPRSQLSTGLVQSSRPLPHLRRIAVAVSASRDQKVPGGAYRLPPAAPLAQGANS
jgi:hypothetical protein